MKAKLPGPDAGEPSAALATGRASHSGPVTILYIEPIGVRGGMGGYNDGLVAAYAEAGARLDVVTSSRDASFGDQVRMHASRLFGFAMDRSKARAFRALSYACGYVGCLRLARRADIVVIHFLHLPAIDRLAIKGFRRLGCRLVLVAHDPQPVLSGQRGPTYERCLRLFDLVVVHGPKARADIVAQGVPDTKVVVAPHGDFRAVAPLDPAVALNALGLAGLARPTAAIIGNMKPGKGIQRAREALEVPGTPVRTLLVAGSRQGTWDLQSALRPSGDSRLQVVQVDRRMSDHEERAAYSLADVVLALYESGYSSGVIARAHSMGKPVVLTNVGDLVLQGHTDDVVVAADYTAAELREAIARCLRKRVEAPTVWDCEAWRHHAGSVLARLG